MTMPHIIFKILQKSMYVMLFAIGYAAYYCYFPFSSSSWINEYYIYNDYIITCFVAVLVLLLISLSV